VVPTNGAYVKSVRYDAKKQLVQGQHKSLLLRVASAEEARDWARALQKSAVHAGSGGGGVVSVV
jgi:hypothetical protein